MRASDALRIFRHAADAAALRADPVVQRQQWLDGLSAILGTHAGWLFAIDDYRPDRTMRYRAQVLTTDPDPHWLTYITEFGVKQPITADPYAVAVLHDGRRRQVWTQAQVLPDEAARERFATCCEAIGRIGVVDGIVGAARVGPGGHNVVGFSLHRLAGRPNADKPLGRRGHDVARLAIVEMARLVEAGTFTFGPPAIAHLPPRLQQTLVRLRDGQSAKQIAQALNLSVHTVREHLQRLYTRYDVSSREELMAKFVGL